MGAWRRSNPGAVPCVALASRGTTFLKLVSFRDANPRARQVFYYKHLSWRPHGDSNRWRPMELSY